MILKYFYDTMEMVFVQSVQFSKKRG